MLMEEGGPVWQNRASTVRASRALSVQSIHPSFPLSLSVSLSACISKARARYSVGVAKKKTEQRSLQRDGESRQGWRAPKLKLKQTLTVSICTHMGTRLGKILHLELTLALLRPGDAGGEHVQPLRTACKGWTHTDWQGI